MAFKKTNKKAQAAIEFLMTYGWMLLVVLIVGALIFSFVDFGGLLPNSVTFSSANMQPIVGDSFVQKNPTNGSGTILIAFRYNGAQPVSFVFDDTNPLYNISYNFGDSSCGAAELFQINNADAGAPALTNTSSVRFRNGHSGFIEFRNCPDLDQVDVVEGTIKLTFRSEQTGANTPIFGDIRLTKVE